MAQSGRQRLAKSRQQLKKRHFPAIGNKARRCSVSFSKHIDKPTRHRRVKPVKHRGAGSCREFHQRTAVPLNITAEMTRANVDPEVLVALG
jgi:hypothetical protein